MSSSEVWTWGNINAPRMTILKHDPKMNIIHNLETVVSIEW